MTKLTDEERKAIAKAAILKEIRSMAAELKQKLVEEKIKK